NAVSRQKRGRAVSLEQRLEELTLEGERRTPDNLRNLLFGARLGDLEGQRARANCCEVLDVQFVKKAARPDNALVDVARAAHMLVVCLEHCIEVLPVTIAEPTTT